MKTFNHILILSALVQIILCSIPCPQDYKDRGVQIGRQMCQMPDSYGRGAGYPWKFGDRLNLDGAKSRCENDNRNLGCEQWGAVIYPKCKQGFIYSGCCICIPQCPSGWDFSVIGYIPYCSKTA